MNLVVNTNVLFSFFWENSAVRRIIMSPSNDFASPELAIAELRKYAALIISKLGISKEKFDSELKRLVSFVKIFPKDFYKDFLKSSGESSPDPGDAEFFALCLKLNAPLWSNDKILKNHDRVIVLNSEEFIDVI